LGVGREAGQNVFAPELPDVGAGDEERTEGLAGGELPELRMEGAEEVAADGDGVVGGRCGEVEGLSQDKDMVAQGRCVEWGA
jgi:hypothetical protein